MLSGRGSGGAEEGKRPEWGSAGGGGGDGEDEGGGGAQEARHYRIVYVGEVRSAAVQIEVRFSRVAFLALIPLAELDERHPASLAEEVGGVSGGGESWGVGGGGVVSLPDKYGLI